MLAPVQNPDAAAPPRPEALHQAAQQVQEIIGHTEPILLNNTVNRVRREVPIPHKDTLHCVVRAIFEMVTSDTIDNHEHDCSRHARCGETYADIMSALRLVVPTFDTEGDRTATFTRILLNVTQDTFEAWCGKFSSADVAGTSGIEDKLIALVSFTGHLYVRRVVAARVMAQVVHDLIGVRDRMPEEPLVRCVCELMQCIGQAIDANKQGNIMTQFLARLSNLAASRKATTQEPVYSQEIRETIRAVHEARFQNWPARAGTQVLVQYLIVSEEDAIDAWRDLKKSEQLPPDQMHLTSPNIVDDYGQHLRIVGVISHRTIAILLNVTTLAESAMKTRIADSTNIHTDRLMVFKPTGELLESDEMAGAAVP